ncbi:MAG: winged helix-turn-helix domain-containing protein [Candidatus Methanoperedens sp.]|nr:winged helix-turn-helix domain-containing protein [Candidatus Methanoperedens sp.]
MGIIGKTKKQILEEINKRPVHGYLLAINLGIPFSTAYEHLKDLQEHNLVEQKVSGRKKLYYLTDNGKMFLKLLK